MSDYAPGMRVIIRDEEWMIKKCDTNSYLTQTLQCVGLSPLVRDKTAYFLSDLEKIEAVNPAKTKLVIDDSPRFTRSRLYMESQWRQVIPTDTDLHIGHKAAMNVIPYQLEPARISLKRPKQRILIADAVGLGKTLEAGILLSELIARGKGRRILVVTVKSMMTQFQKEMWNRFTIPLISLDSAEIKSIRRDLPTNHNPFHYYDKTIVSIDTIKRDVEYRTHLENAWWDVIVIDEAHNVAERGSHQAQRARLAQLLSSRSDTLIMLSATPHDGSARSFASLMNMLDPTAIADPDHYTGEDIKGLFLRRFKKDIQDQTEGQFQERHIYTEDCWASPVEEAAFDCFTEIKSLLNGSDGNQLKAIVFEKALFSSPAACLKSIALRIKKLEKECSEDSFKEKAALQKLQGYLMRIESHQFSRYTRLLSLLKSEEYGWNPANEKDRIVIFTERIETMRYLAEYLRQDLKLKDDAVQELYGGMIDTEQQNIVENFGRNDSPIRILVASDVASEGINLHYLSHRMIHFDIPWSLMVFQQRNGRIDRYGQTQEPDIRYMVIKSHNENIHGDMRILEILIQKEEQANINIGDPAMLMKVFDAQREEDITAQAIIAGNAKAFETALNIGMEEEPDFFTLLMQGANADETKPASTPTIMEKTLYTDIEYLYDAFAYLSRDQIYSVSRLNSMEGLEIKLTPDMKRYFQARLPEEAIPENEVFRLSPNKDTCMEEMRKSLQNLLSENAWPSIQYLWPLHPMISWVHDKAGQFFGRQEAPLVGLHGKLMQNEQIFCVAGLIPNRRGTPLVDKMFCLRYAEGKCLGSLSMEELLKTTAFDTNQPNIGGLTEQRAVQIGSMLPQVIERARLEMTNHYNAYVQGPYQQIYEELDKLEGLKARHQSHIRQKYEQLTFFDKERRLNRELNKIDEIFEGFYKWVQDAMEIENNPYLRIIAVFTGV